MLIRVIQCRARYESLRKGKAKATMSVDGDRSSKPPDDEGDKHSEPSEATRPTPRKRLSAKAKGKQPATSLVAEGSTQVDDNVARLPKRPRGRPRKVPQNETPTTPGDGGSNLKRAERPTPRKRGKLPGVKPRESAATTDGPGVEDT
jgi:hypothetical protein